MPWERWKPDLVLASESVHVLVWPIARSGAESSAVTIAQLAREPRQLLDQDELQRADRFVYAGHRLPYVQAHIRMRQILGRYLRIPPEDVLYSRDKAGKPCLLDETLDLRFNLSHTDGWCALVVCRGPVEAGIDVERVRAMEAQVAESHFSAREREQLRSMNGDAWREAFFRCWTRKEALVKGEGVGLRAPLDAFDVSLLPGDGARLLAARPEAGFRRSWTLHHFEPEPGILGAVALSAPLQPVFYRLQQRQGEELP